MTLRRVRPCPICGKPVALSKDGRIRWHRDTRRRPGGIAPINPACTGTSRLPDEPTTAPRDAKTAPRPHCDDEPPINHTCPRCGRTTLEGASE